MIHLQQLLEQTQQRISKVSESAGLDAQVLLAHVLGKSRTWLLAHPAARLDETQAALLERLTLQLEAGEPLPYVISHWEFFRLDFLLNPAVMIPRPETELLVEFALRWLAQHPARTQVLDVGTGSGCIAIALSVNRPPVHILACDLSYDAVLVARENSRRHAVSPQINFIVADLLPPTVLKFDLLCANLPYIPTDKLRHLTVAVHEPPGALDGGEDGLALIADLLTRAHIALSPTGLILLEIEASQGHRVAEIARAFFPSADIQVHPDLSGHDRLLSVQT